MTKINRITFEENRIRGFEGRVKIDDIDMATLDLKDFMAAANRVEEHLATVLLWQPVPVNVGAKSNVTTWKLVAGTSKDIGADLALVRKLVANESVPGGAPRQLPPRADGKKRMNIPAERRVRQSPLEPVEDALSDFVTERIKSKTILNYPRLLHVAKENAIEIRGENNGHRKMNVQTILRSRYRRGEQTWVNGKEFTNPNPVEVEKKRKEKLSQERSARKLVKRGAMT